MYLYHKVDVRKKGYFCRTSRTYNDDDNTNNAERGLLSFGEMPDDFEQEEAAEDPQEPERWSLNCK